MRRSIAMAVLCAMLVVPAVCSAGEADVVRQNVLASFKALVEQGDVAKCTENFADTVEYEVREDGWTSTHIRGKEKVRAAIAEGPPSGTLVTTAKMIHVALIGDEAQVIADFAFTTADGDQFKAVILMSMTKADGRWLTTRVVLCDNAPQ